MSWLLSNPFSSPNGTRSKRYRIVSGNNESDDDRIEQDAEHRHTQDDSMWLWNYAADKFESMKKVPRDSATTTQYSCIFTYCGLLSLVIVTVVISIAALTEIIAVSIPIRHPTGQLSQCTNLSVRKEWRHLTPAEQAEYIDSILCLTQTPSMGPGRGSLYDDLAATHINFAPRIHYSAPFFPWHRFFLRIFETQIRDVCGYRGPLPYWDWTLDWRNLSGSPVFDNTLGFGGDGDGDYPGPLPLSADYPRQAYCVTTGRFGDMRLLHGTISPTPHCLSRVFFNYRSNTTGDMFGNSVAPGRVRHIEASKTYDEFRNKTEYMIHNTIHGGIGGDFERWSSANDPIFYLHHAQLDRLWWKWQESGPGRRLEYYGRRERGSSAAASLSDRLSFSSLWKTIAVGEVMNISGRQLCYVYE